MVKLIIKLMGASEDCIEFVEDRKGHDERYAIDFHNTYEKIGWKSRYDRSNFEEKLKEVIEFY